MTDEVVFLLLQTPHPSDFRRPPSPQGEGFKHLYLFVKLMTLPMVVRQNRSFMIYFHRFLHYANDVY